MIKQMQFSIPQTLGTMQAIPSGPEGTRQTLKLMRDIVRRAVRDPRMIVRNQAIAITRACPSKDWRCEILAVYDWVNENIRFLRDVNGVETLQSPARTLELAVGDCDDQAILISALLESIGHATRFAALGFEPGHFSHVFSETKIGDRWLSLETTVPGAFPGWYPPRVSERMVQKIQSY